MYKNEILEKVIRFMNIVNQTNKGPFEYGTGHKLYLSEIHTIEAISNHYEMNASELANILGVTSGAITQVTGKLIKKGLVEKYNMNHNKKEVYYRLTESGKLVNAVHEKHHEVLYKKIEQSLAGMNPDSIKTINEFLDSMIQYWPQDI